MKHTKEPVIKRPLHRRTSRPPMPMRWFHRYILRLAHAGLKREMRAFDALSSRLPAYPITTRARLRNVLRRQWLAKKYYEVFSLPVALLYYVLGLAACAYIQFRFLQRFDRLVGAFFLGCLLSYLLLSIVALDDWTERKRILSAALLLMAIGAPVASAAAWSWWISSGDLLAQRIGAASVGGTILVWSLMVLSVVLANFRQLIRVLTGCGPDTLAIGRTLDLLRDLDTKSYSWNNLVWRRAIAVQMESIASSIERCGRWLRRVGDPASAIWSQERMSRIAASIREKKKWLITPRADTQEHLWGSMSALFIGLIQCDWDSLPQNDTSPLSGHDLVRAALRRFGGVLVAIGIPAGLFWIIQLSPATALQNPVRDYVAGVLLLWVLVVLLSAADPLYQSRVEAFRNMVQVFPFGKKDKEK